MSFPREFYIIRVWDFESRNLDLILSSSTNSCVTLGKLLNLFSASDSVSLNLNFHIHKMGLTMATHPRAVVRTK